MVPSAICAKIVLRPAPEFAINFAIRKIANTIYKKHSRVSGRLSDIYGTSFLVNITDLNCFVKFIFYEGEVKSQFYRVKPDYSEVYISGEFSKLLEMLGGNADGDALFFSRNLTVEGNTEALLTLRNAIDSEEINLSEEFFQLFGPFSSLIRHAGNDIGRLFSTVNNDLESLATFLIQPIRLQQNKLQEENSILKQKLSSLEHILEKQQKNIDKLMKRMTA